MKEITRPAASGKKIHSKDEFELCYLRHQYVRRVNFNPSESQMQPYIAIIKNLSRKTYITYRNIFTLVGFDLDDIISIGRVHLVSFLGLFSLEQMPNKYANLLELYNRAYDRDPNSNEILDKNKANLTMFMKQRMEDVVRVCRQKARNIKGMPTDEFYAFIGPNEPPKDCKIDINNYEKYQFKKIGLPVFKTIKKKLKIKDNKPFKFANRWYLSVAVDKRNLTFEDLSGSNFNPYDSIHNKDPEQLMIMNEKEHNIEAQTVIFKNKDNSTKISIVEEFIVKNKKNPSFKKEVRFAKKYLKELNSDFAE